MHNTINSPRKAYKSDMTGSVGLAAAARNVETPPRPAMDIKMVEDHFDARWLTQKRANICDRNQPHLFADNALDQFSIWHDQTGKLHWLDLTTGAGGDGTLSLAMHVLKVGMNEAAFRMAALVIARRYNGKGIDFFVAPKAA